MSVLNSLDEPRIRAYLTSDRHFWLNLSSAREAEVERPGDLLRLHPLAAANAKQFGQRPKLHEDGHHLLLVFYGACEHHADEEPLREVHLLVSGSYLVSVPNDGVAELEALEQDLDGQPLRSEQFPVYRVLDALTDSFFPPLARIDNEIDDIEDQVVAGNTQQQLQRTFARKRELVAMRRVVTPQRDLLVRSDCHIGDLPGRRFGARDYFRDVYDMIRISELIDSYRDLLAGAIDMYLTAVSNRQNEVMKQLAIIATIFLPLSFLTGFFGQNFAWLLKIQTPVRSFFVFGIGGLLVAGLVLVASFKRKCWLWTGIWSRCT